MCVGGMLRGEWGGGEGESEIEKGFVWMWVCVWKGGRGEGGIHVGVAVK